MGLRTGCAKAVSLLDSFFSSSVQEEVVSTGLQRSSDTAVLSVSDDVQKEGWETSAEWILARGWIKKFLTEGAGS